MINFLKLIPPRTGGFMRILALLGLVLMNPPVALAKAPHYKQKSVVDFDDALVEGKSRKPYSTYLSKENAGDFRDVNSWGLDFASRQRSARLKAELTP